MPQGAVTVRQATVDDLELIAPLFDAYRQFYREPADPDGARQFLLRRFEHNQSVIFLALDGSFPIGFTQLYPSFSSTAMGRILILNDLFVSSSTAQTGCWGCPTPRGRELRAQDRSDSPGTVNRAHQCRGSGPV